MNNSIDDCFLDKSNSKNCLGDNPKNNLLIMITRLYNLIIEKEAEYLKTNEYSKDEITKIELYINNLLKHVKFYIGLDEEDQEEANVENAAAAAVEEVNAAAEEAKRLVTEATNLLEKAEAAAVAAKTAAEANAAVAAAEAAVAAAEAAVVTADTAVANAQKVAEKAVAAVKTAADEALADTQKVAEEAKKLVTEATNLLAKVAEEAVAAKTAAVEEAALKKSKVQLFRSTSSSSQALPQKNITIKSSQSSSLARALQSQLESTKNTTGLQLSDNKFAVIKTNRKFIINLIKILNFGLDTKITNNNTTNINTNINQNFNQKINNIVQQNNNIIHALYGNNSNNTTINFGNENTIVKPLFLTDGFIYNEKNIEINKYYTPLFGIDKDNNFQSIPNSGENNNLITYKLILFMIKFDYIGLNKYNNIYDDNNIKSINYLDKRYNTLNNNKFLKITDNIYKINKKYYYDYTSDNIQKHIIKKVVV
jgi:hypothetical protein